MRNAECGLRNENSEFRISGEASRRDQSEFDKKGGEGLFLWPEFKT